MFLEGFLVVALGGEAGGRADHAVAFLETGYVGPDGYYFAGDVLSEDGGIDERVYGCRLKLAVDRVDGDGMVPYKDLILSWVPERGGLDLEWTCFGGCDPSGYVGCHSVLVLGDFRWICLVVLAVTGLDSKQLFLTES